MHDFTHNPTMSSSKVSSSVRKAIVPAITVFAAANNLPFNKASGAVLFAAEQLDNPNQVNVEALLTLECMEAYSHELRRRNNARAAQLVGMVKNALPKAQRTEENIISILSRMPEHAAISQIQKLIHSEVQELNPTPMFEGFAKTKSAI